MSDTRGDVLVGIDAGTSVIKAVAFDLAGRQLGVAALPNQYVTRATDGAAFQSMQQTWASCAATLRELSENVPDLAARTAALAVTAQGDGTWLVGAKDEPVTDGWIWLDSRAARTAERLRANPCDASRFRSTGTGLNACQMGTQLAHLAVTAPEVLEAAEIALHPKDWLYLKLTGQRVTDPSEANFTFGNFRTRQYEPQAIEALGLTRWRSLLPEIVDGTAVSHPLTAQAAMESGLLAGTPVSLGFVDVVCTAVGAGICTSGVPAACTIIGSTAMHMRAKTPNEVRLNDDRTGYVMVLPIPGMVAQMQSTMAATLNIDWVLAFAADLAADLAQPVSREALIDRIDGWIASARPGALLYHPYISEAGERGPFVSTAARASLNGLSIGHRFPDLVRGVVEGLGLAARDCFAAMGDIPTDLRLTGGAARSESLRTILSAALNAPVRVSTREEAGAAGAAMMAAVAIGAAPDMETCIETWVAPNLQPLEAPDPALVKTYNHLFPAYVGARKALLPIWEQLARNEDGTDD